MENFVAFTKDIGEKSTWNYFARWQIFLSAPGEARALVNLTFSPPFPNTFANCPYIFFLTIPRPIGCLGPLCPVRASTCFLTKSNCYGE